MAWISTDRERYAEPRFFSEFLQVVVFFGQQERRGSQSCDEGIYLRFENRLPHRSGVIACTRPDRSHCPTGARSAVHHRAGLFFERQLTDQVLRPRFRRIARQSSVYCRACRSC